MSNSLGKKMNAQNFITVVKKILSAYLHQREMWYFT